MNTKEIRRLGPIESIYDFETLNNTHLLAIIIRVEVSDHALLTVDVLNNARTFWLKRYPLLHSKIVRADYEESKKKIMNDRYFATLDDNIELNNIEVIETDEEMKWSELVEEDLKVQLDMINGPLWRLKVIKLMNKDNNTVHFLFTTHHSYTDGKNCCIFVEYLNIVAALLENKTCEEMSGQPIKIHTFVEDLITAQISSGQLSLKPSAEHGPVDTTSRVPTKTGKPNGTYSKFEHITIQSDRFRKLMRQLKKNTNNCKLNGLLEALFALAMKQTLTKYGETHIVSMPFQFFTFVSVRNKLKLDDNEMGVYSVGLMSRLDVPENGLDDIWTTAEDLSKKLHERLGHDEDIHRILEGYGVDKIEQGFDTFEANFNHGLSNIGLFDNTRESSVLKTTQISFGMPFLEKRFPGTIFGFTSTINDTLTWTMSFNELTYSREFIREMLNSIDGFIDKLIAD